MDCSIQSGDLRRNRAGDGGQSQMRACQTGARPHTPRHRQHIARCQHQLDSAVLWAQTILVAVGAVGEDGLAGVRVAAHALRPNTHRSDTAHTRLVARHCRRHRHARNRSVMTGAGVAGRRWQAVDGVSRQAGAVQWCDECDGCTSTAHRPRTTPRCTQQRGWK